MTAATSSSHVSENPRDLSWGEPPLPEWVTEFRPHQLQAVENILDAYNQHNKTVVFEGPPGTGKTLVAELVRRQLGARALYVCSDLTLQDQFVRDFPYAALIKSARNYSAHKPEFTCDDCDRSHVDGHWRCTFCDPVAACPYLIARDQACAEPLAVTNLAYALRDWAYVGRLRGRQLVIIDECDLLENILMGFVEFRVRPGTLKKLCVSAPVRCTRKTTICDWIVNDLLPATNSTLDDLKDTTAANITRWRFRKQLLRLRDEARTVAVSLAENPDRWVRDNDGPIILQPVSVADYADQYVWQHGQRFLLMSATVISPEQMMADLGA